MHRRRGSMLMEATIATVLLATAAVGIAQLIIAVGRQQRSLEWRRLATFEASNLLEMAMARDYNDVTPDTLSTTVASAELRQVLPTAQASVGVEQVGEDPRGKQITVRIRWRNFAGLEEHVQLTAWKYALIPEAATP